MTTASDKLIKKFREVSLKQPHYCLFLGFDSAILFILKWYLAGRKVTKSRAEYEPE